MYSITDSHLEALRDQNDRTKMFARSGTRSVGGNTPGTKMGDMLPNLETPQIKVRGDLVPKFTTQDFLNEQKVSPFVAGDTRCSENMQLSSWHTMFLRLHNIFADGLKPQMTQASDEDIFLEARQLVIATYQHITYGEFLPQLMGVPAFLKFPDLMPSPPTEDGVHREHLRPSLAEPGKKF